MSDKNTNFASDLETNKTDRDMKPIYTITYVSLINGHLWSETKVYDDREKMKADYRHYVDDIADNIDDDEQRGEFIADYHTNDPCANVHWESLDGTVMYMLTTEINVIQ